LKERSALTREAMDYIQEAGFLKATKHTSSTPLTPPSEWEILFHEHRGGVQVSFFFLFSFKRVLHEHRGGVQVCVLVVDI